MPHSNALSPVAPHGRPLPGKLENGREYIFHNPLPTKDAIWLGREVFAERLQEQGFSLIGKNDGIFGVLGVLDLSHGGGFAYYSIPFVRGRCSGEIAHTPDRELNRNEWPWVKSRWEIGDYILTIKGECEF